MSFIYFGTPYFSTYVLDELERASLRPSLVVTTSAKPAGRNQIVVPSAVKEWALSRHIPTLEPEKLGPEFISELKNQEAQLGIVAAYGKLIPEKLLEIFPHGVLNVHPSLLPIYRGPTPVQTAILHGDKKTGVSIILLDNDMDHGPILDQNEFLIEGRDRVGLDDLLWHEGGKLLAEIIPKWLNREIEPKAQDDTLATFTKKFETIDAFIKPEIILGIAPEDEVLLSERKVRALNPDPGTWSLFEPQNLQAEVRFKILSAEIRDNKLLPLRVVPAGKKEMAWQEFLRGYRR